MAAYTIQPFVHPLKGTIQLPGSKSISNRALLLCAIGVGSTTLVNLNDGADTRILIQALRRLGVSIEVDQNQARILGTQGSFPNQHAHIYVGNAGTVARFLLPILAAQSQGTYYLDSCPAMQQRPMRALLETLEFMGARFEFTAEPYHYPFTLYASGLSGGILPTIATDQTSQFLSALLMAAPLYKQPIILSHAESIVSAPFIDMTCALISTWGYELESTATEYSNVRIHPSNNGYTNPLSYTIEADATAASYFIGLSYAVGGTLGLPNFNPRSSLQKDSAFLNYFDPETYQINTTEAGTILNIAQPTVPSFYGNFNPISDTFLTAAALAPLADAPTHITGIQHVRHQECDRIEAMACGLIRLGQRVETTSDSITIFPDTDALRKRSFKGPVMIDTRDDHRVAMSFAILGSYNFHNNGRPWLSLSDSTCVDKTFACFFEQLNQLHTCAH